MAMIGIAFLLALTVHEYAHARAALAAGDDTAQRAGRISLNPLDHLDPLGTIMFVLMMLNGFGIAWGKPVPVDPYRFKSPRWDSLKVSLWGPLSNMITAVVLAVVFRSLILPAQIIPYQYVELVLVCIRLNLVLAFFNLIPVPPLDGSKILVSLLPLNMARSYERTIGQYGLLILIALLFTGVVGRIIGPPIDFSLRLLVFGRLF